jgi:hypothetical protein
VLEDNASGVVVAEAAGRFAGFGDASADLMQEYAS